MKRDGRREEFERDEDARGIEQGVREATGFGRRRSSSSSTASSARSRSSGRTEIASSLGRRRVLDELVRSTRSRPRASRRCSSISRTPRITRPSSHPLGRREARRAETSAMTPRGGDAPGARSRAARARPAPCRIPPVGAVVFRGDRVLGRGARATPAARTRRSSRSRGALRRHGATRAARRDARRHARAVRSHRPHAARASTR